MKYENVSASLVRGPIDTFPSYPSRMSGSVDEAVHSRTNGILLIVIRFRIGGGVRLHLLGLFHDDDTLDRSETDLWEG